MLKFIAKRKWDYNLSFFKQNYYHNLILDGSYNLKMLYYKQVYDYRHECECDTDLKYIAERYNAISIYRNKIAKSNQLKSYTTMNIKETMSRNWQIGGLKQ
ncbi:MAG: hypothetical protein IKR19_08770 [Acholeplasmatales bacterium]|nr:hypothetical protein [Acholeplasmatales bacterium]